LPVLESHADHLVSELGIWSWNLDPLEVNGDSATDLNGIQDCSESSVAYTLALLLLAQYWLSTPLLGLTTKSRRVSYFPPPATQLSPWKLFSLLPSGTLRRFLLSDLWFK